MIEFFNLRKGLPKVIYVPHAHAECEDYMPPVDATIERVWYDYNRQSIVVCMSHPDWQEVSDGEEITGYSAFAYVQGYKIEQQPVMV